MEQHGTTSMPDLSPKRNSPKACSKASSANRGYRLWSHQASRVVRLAGLDKEGGGLRATRDVQLGEDRREVVLDRLFGQAQAVADFLVGQSLRQVGHDAAFLGGKLVESSGGGHFPAMLHEIEHLPRHRGIDHGADAQSREASRGNDRR